MGKQAMRHNDGKLKLSYILDAPEAVKAFARVMKQGEEKYPRGNWRKGLPPEEVIDSLLRHLVKYRESVLLDQPKLAIDDESGLHHLDHVLANAIFLCEHQHMPVEQEWED